MGCVISGGVEARQAAGERRGITVVIPTINRPTLTQALAALVESAQFVDEPVEVIVVDDRQVPSAGSIVDAHERRGVQIRVVRTFDAGVSGPSAARNLGLTKANFDVIAFTDDDARCDVGWLAAGLTRLRADAEIAGVEGAVHLDSTYPIDPVRSRIVMNLKGGGYLTASLFVRAQAALAVGGFAPFRSDSRAWAALVYREDTDFALRIIRTAGAIPFVPEAVVFHPAEAVSLRRMMRVAGYFVADAAFARLHPDACPPVWRRPLSRIRIRLATAMTMFLPAIAYRRLRRAAALALLAAGTAISFQFEVELRSAGVTRSRARVLVDTIRRVPRSILWGVTAGSARMRGEALLWLGLMTISTPQPIEADLGGHARIPGVEGDAENSRVEEDRGVSGRTTR